MLVGTLRTRTSRYCTSQIAGLPGVVAPAAQHVFDRRIGMVGVVRVVRVVHGGDVGHDRRPHIVVVVGGDAHPLRTLDQERGVADIADAHLIGVERGEIERRRQRPAAAPGRPGRDTIAPYRLAAPAVARVARRRRRRTPSASARPAQRTAVSARSSCGAFCQALCQAVHASRRSGSLAAPYMTASLAWN